MSNELLALYMRLDTLEALMTRAVKEDKVEAYAYLYKLRIELVKTMMEVAV